MNKFLASGWVALMVFAQAGLGADVHTETWDADAAGWTAATPEMAAAHSAFGGGSLQGVFADQQVPASEVGAFRAAASASSGAFAGNYWSVFSDFKGWQFDYYAADVLPSALYVRFSDGVNIYQANVADQLTAAGEWTTLQTPGYQNGLSGWIGPDGLAGVSNALTNVQWVEVRVERNGADEQIYYADNFQHLSTPRPPPPTHWTALYNRGQPVWAYFLGDTLAYQFEFAINTDTAGWTVEYGLGQAADGTDWTWRSANWSRMDGENNRVWTSAQNEQQFTATGDWYYAGRFVSPATDIYSVSTDWVANSGEALAAESTFSVTAIPAPANVSAAVNAGEPTSQIDWTWEQNSAGHDVMVVRKLAADAWGEPVQGTAYAAEDSIGAGTVAYVGGATSASASGMAEGTAYDFKFYSVNNGYYSAGETASAGTLQSQTIDFPAISGQLTTDTVELSATASSGLPVSFSVVSGSAALDGTTLTFTGAGEVSIAASQPGDANWAPAEEVVQTFQVTEATATVILSNLSHIYDGDPKEATFTTDPEGLPIVVTYDGSSQAPVEVGSYEVVATIDHALYSGSATDTLVIEEHVSLGSMIVGWGVEDPRRDVGQIDIPDGLTNVTDIASGDMHSLALLSDGTVVGWGANEWGQCDLPGGLAEIMELAAGGYHNVALLVDGTVAAWGSNWEGQCDVPPGLNNVIKVAAGSLHSMALKSDGTLVAWGDNWYGQSDIPEGLDDVVDIAIHTYHSLALRSDGTVVAWGWNEEGQCDVPEGLANVTAISASVYHSLALLADGTVVAWGDNAEGQCDVPAGLDNVTAIATGTGHSLALLSDGTVVAWGANYAGQCNVPEDLGNVRAIAAGQQHSLALRDAPNEEEPLSLELSKSTVNVREGGEGRFFVRLSQAPDREMVALITRSAGDAGVTVAAGATRVFTPANWNIWQAVTLAAEPDAKAATFQIAGAGLAARTVETVTLEDREGNLALASAGATVTFSGASQAGQLLDGIHHLPDNYGYANWTRPPPGWIQVDLQVPTAVTSMRLLNWDWTYRLNTYRIEGSLNGSDWTLLADAAEPRHGWEVWELESDPVRYLRFTGVSNTVNFAVIISEWEVYGTPATGRQDQSIVFPAIGDQVTSSVLELSATASSGLPVTFSVVSGPAVLEGATLSFTGSGVITVAASQAGDEEWHPASDVVSTFNVTEPLFGIELSKTSVNVREGGEGRVFVRLADEPSGTVVVTVNRVAGDTGVSVLSGLSRVFTPANWNIWQAVTLAASAGAESATFRVRAAGAADRIVEATVLAESFGENRALAAAGSIVTSVGATRPEQLIDGIYGDIANHGHTSWMRTPPGWIRLDLQEPLAVTRMRLLNWDWTWRVHTYQIEGSLDGMTWTVIADASEDPSHGWDDWELDGTPYRYLRFTGLSNSANGAVVVSEWEVYGEPVHVRMPQTIELAAIADPRSIDTVELLATASSGLPVVFTVLSGPAVLDETSLTFTAPGEVAIEAAQPGNEDWAAAEPVVRTFTVRPPEDMIEVSQSHVNVRESGEGRFFIRLKHAPVGPMTVVVAYDSGDADLLITQGAVRTFTAQNWNRWLPVTLTAPPDDNAENETAILRVSAIGAHDVLVQATVLDGDIGENVALASRGATIVGGLSVTRPEMLIDGIHMDNGNYAHTIWDRTPSGWVTVDLQEPMDLTRMRLLNWDWTYRLHRYTVEASLDGESWTVVADASEVARHGWDDWALDGSPIRYLRFTGLYNSVHGAVCIAEMEVYVASESPEGASMPKAVLANEEPDQLPAFESIPMLVLTSDGPDDETGWLALDGDPETAWVGQKAGGGYLVIGYEPTMELSAVEVDMVEDSLTTIEFLYSLDAEEWQPLPDDMETHPVELNYLWLVFPDDGSDAVPQVIEVRPNP